MPITLNPKQAEALKLLAGPQRHTLLVGGSRSGKSFLLVEAILARAMQAPGSRHAIFRFRGNAVWRAIGMDTLPKVIELRRPDYRNALNHTVNKVEQVWQFENGSQVWLAGLDDKARVERVLGQEFATIMFNEISEIPYSSVSVAMTRLAQSVNKLDGAPLKPRAYYDMNPGGTGHWSYRLFVEGREPDSMKLLLDDRRANYAMMYMNPVDNLANLPSGYLDTLADLPERQRRRFLDGLYQPEVDGALWTLEILDRQRVEELPVPLQRVVIAVDPSGHNGMSNSGSDAIGIVAAGKGADGNCYLLEDFTLGASPEKWGRAVVAAYHKHQADAVVAEGNYGGDMVRAIIHSVDSSIPVRMVTATRGKAIRAEPVSALYEQGKVFHVGDAARWRALEDEMLNFSLTGYAGDRSPNRCDSLVWATTDLMLSGPKPAEIVPVVGIGQASGWRI